MKEMKWVVIVLIVLTVGLLFFNRWMNQQVDLLVDSTPKVTKPADSPASTVQKLSKPATVKIDPANDPLAPRTAKIIKSEAEEVSGVVKSKPTKIFEPAMEEPEFLIQ